MKKIYYLAYYGDRDTENCRNSHPAAELQVLYLVQVLNELGYEVEIVSPSGVGKVKKFLMYSREYTWQIKKGVRVRYFPSLGSRFKIIPILCRYWMTIRKLKQFIKNFRRAVLCSKYIFKNGKETTKSIRKINWRRGINAR